MSCLTTSVGSLDCQIHQVLFLHLTRGTYTLCLQPTNLSYQLHVTTDRVHTRGVCVSTYSEIFLQHGYGQLFDHRFVLPILSRNATNRSIICRITGSFGGFGGCSLTRRRCIIGIGCLSFALGGIEQRVVVRIGQSGPRGTRWIDILLWT
jgi:hypothetical protein